MGDWVGIPVSEIEGANVGDWAVGISVTRTIVGMIEVVVGMSVPTMEGLKVGISVRVPSGNRMGEVQVSASNGPMLPKSSFMRKSFM